MKLFLNNKTPVLTEEDKPSWHCSNTCCFHQLYMDHALQVCRYFGRNAKKNTLTLYKIKYTIFLNYESPL